MTARRAGSGGRIDRATRLDFRWDGRELHGYAGDTLASALLAANQRVLGRSFKYHRPRGLMSAGVEESGAIVTVGEGARRDANVRATTQELYQGLVASGQNGWPSVRVDLGAINGLFAPFLAAGFYYKTFMGWPPFEWGRGTGVWMRYESLIRKAAGMGRASRLPDPDRYEHAHAWCDVLVVGAGPSGLQAALTAAGAGLDVLLVEQDFEAGGDLLMRPGAGRHTQQELLARVRAAGARVMTRTTVFGLYDGGVAGLLERVSDHLARPPDALPRQRYWVVRAKQTILATGALERHFAFADNDRPGVMSCSAARAYLHRYAVLAGERIVIAGNNDSCVPVACELAQAGARVILLDAREQIARASARQLNEAGVQLRSGATACRVRGRAAVRGVDVAVSDGAGWRRRGRLACDSLLLSGGWSPVVNLLSHRGHRPRWDAENACFVAPQVAGPVHVAGAAAGYWQDGDCLASGEAAATAAIAGLAAGQVRGADASAPAATIRAGGWRTPIRPLYEVAVAGLRGKRFVDPQHDVTAADVRLAHREGFVSIEHLKRYTTLGMANDQGKMGNVIGLALMAEALGREIPDVGTTTFRPPYTPVSLGALSGRHRDAHFKPVRRTPMHQWNLQHGARMTEAGLWLRPWYFSDAGESVAEAGAREAATVRASVGICDVTSLGKIAVHGPDATEFLNRVYANPFARLPVGRARYGIMLRDDGVVMDDGTSWRLADTEYFMTTTTAHAGKVMAWLEQLLQMRWPTLCVHLQSVTDQWAAVAVAGPRARDVLAACAADAACVQHQALPFLGVTQTMLRDRIPCRIARISFSGELAYEVYVPSDYGVAMMELLWPAAQAVGGCLYGLEALGTLRIEKGHVTGAELDGRVTLEDVGLGRMAGRDKAFIGSALRQRPGISEPDRPQLVGLFPVDRAARFNAGAILCRPGQESGFGEGWVSSVTHSPAIGHWIGLGLVRGGLAGWHGRTLVAADPVGRGSTQVQVVAPQMFDPDGSRMHG